MRIYWDKIFRPEHNQDYVQVTNIFMSTLQLARHKMLTKDLWLQLLLFINRKGIIHSSEKALSLERTGIQ